MNRATCGRGGLFFLKSQGFGDLFLGHPLDLFRRRHRLQAQTDALAFLIDADHAQEMNITFLDDGPRVLNRVARKLGNV